MNHLDTMSPRGSSREYGGQNPLIPCFLDGSATLMIPHKNSKSRKSCLPFESGCADAAAEDGRSSSNVS
jgi:hypothetical protein